IVALVVDFIDVTKLPIFFQEGGSILVFLRLIFCIGGGSVLVFLSSHFSSLLGVTVVVVVSSSVLFHIDIFGADSLL
ncbi:5564_t:CDS:2, partial [Gigaspora margarita]